jgi:AcrR family transcriptional regulator
MDQQKTIVETDEPKRGSPEIRQAQITKAAMRCFQRKGYDNTTIDDITAEYGLSKGSIYWYYSSKKDILIAVFEHMISELFEGYRSQVLSDISPKQKLINMLRLFVETLLKNHEACRPFIVLMGVAYEDEELRKMVAELYKQAEQQIEEILKQGEAAGEFIVPNKKVVSSVAIAAGEGLLTRQILIEDLDLDEIDREVEAIVEGFLTSGKQNKGIRKTI